MNDHEQRQIFDEWFTRLKPLVSKIVRAFAFTASDQDDLFQEIALQVWKSVPSFRNQSLVTTWLYRIGLNTAIKWSQKEKKHRRSAEPIEQLEHLLRDETETMDDRIAWIYEEIARLDVIDRSIALLLLDGLSYREMSAIVGISESNVGVKINRIKKKLTEKSKNINHGI
ncbi:MAG: RNA polymerase sigma factor [Chitinophagaceae bacterium]|nr:MAG: RNA polymerase sigma factor [Chitinophagaceae bacterium]